MSLAHSIAAASASLAIRVLRALGPSRASTLAGAAAGAIGPLLPPSKIARANLAAAMPELDRAARARIVRGVWKNLGQTIGELPHLASLQEDTPAGPGFHIEGLEIFETLRDAGGPAILFSAHIGNWEILSRAARAHNVHTASLYRAAGNTKIDALIMDLRRDSAGNDLTLFPKGAPGARQAIGHLGRKGFMALLVDQKLNDGIESRFFGLPAMTAPAAATFALHFNCPLVPVLTRRLGPARIEIVVEPPFPHPNLGERAHNIAALTQAMNDTVERWVRQDPASWLWLHRRWTREAVPAAGSRAKAGRRPEAPPRDPAGVL